MPRRGRIALCALAVTRHILRKTRRIERRAHPCTVELPARARGGEKRQRVTLARRAEVDP